jgi:hypothetical protein
MVTGTDLTDDEVNAVLLGDVVEYVAYVGVDDVDADGLADEAGLAVLRALRRLRLVGGRRRGPRLRRRVVAARHKLQHELAAFEARALARGRAERDLKRRELRALAHRVPDAQRLDERRRELVRRRELRAVNARKLDDDAAAVGPADGVGHGGRARDCYQRRLARRYRA